MPRPQTQAKMATIANATLRTQSDDNSGQQAVLQAIADLKQELLVKIDEKEQEQASEVRSQIMQLREEMKTFAKQANSRYEEIRGKVTSLEVAATDHSDSITTLTCEVNQMKTEMQRLKEKNEDLEARSRRSSIRVTGVREHREDGRCPTDFIAEMLKEALALDKLPLLDRAHRTLRQRPGDDRPTPRAFVVRCHYFQEKEAILRKAAERRQLTTADGDQICILPDYTQVVTKQRAAFREVRSQLRGCDGVRYGLWYPAELRVPTPDGKRTSFLDPAKAKYFISSNLLPKST